MASNELETRVDVLESRMDRVCKFLSGICWSCCLEEFDSLQQEIMRLKKRLIESISELKGKMDGEIKPKFDKLETKIAELVPVIVDKFKKNEKKKGLTKEVFSIDVKYNVAQIKVKDKDIKEVSEECLEGLSMIMKEYGDV